MTQPVFAHGSRAGILLDDRDLTRFTHTFNFASDVAQDESTCLQAPGGGKEFLYGNNGGSAGIDGRLAKNRTIVERDFAAVMGGEDDPKLLTMSMFGFEAGRMALMFKTRRQSFRVTGGTSSVVNTSASFQAESQKRVGRMLLSPRGTSSLSLNQKYTLSAAAATVAGVFTVRDVLNNVLGTVTIALTDTASQIATKIATLSYNGSPLTATVTGSLASDSNSLTISGAGTVAANGIYTDTAAVLNDRPVYMKVGGGAYLYWALGPNGWTIYSVSGDTTNNTWYYVLNSELVPPQGVWAANAGGSAPPPTLSMGYNGTFAVEITSPAATPLSFTTATNGWAAQEVQPGGVSNGLNVLSTATTGTPVKTATVATVTKENQSAGHLHAPFVSAGTVSIPVIIEHAPDVSGSPGAWAQLLAFTTITSGTNRAQTAQQVILPAGTTVQPWLRVRVPSITGSAAIGVAFAR